MQRYIDYTDSMQTVVFLSNPTRENQKKYTEQKSVHFGRNNHVLKLTCRPINRRQIFLVSNLSVHP